jgi:polyisoprenoid-binding protein YceI
MAEETAAVPVRTVNGRLVPAAGTYRFDPPHSQVVYEIGHMTIAKSHGAFQRLSGTIHVADQVEQSSVEVEVEVGSISTTAAARDAHVLSEAIMQAEKHPLATYRASKVEHQADGSWRIPGELTLLGKSRPLALIATFGGGVIDPWGKPRIAFSATTEFNREDWGIDWNTPVPGFGPMLGTLVKITVEVQATLDQPS